MLGHTKNNKGFIRGDSGGGLFLGGDGGDIAVVEYSFRKHMIGASSRGSMYIRKESVLVTCEVRAAILS